MALKDIFTAVKKSGYIVGELDLYLLSLNNEDSDRAVDVNAPSQIGGCLRSRYFARTGAPADVNAVSPRSRRIFDNGSHVHVRIQTYLLKQGKLLMDEVPVFNPDYNIQGHTDGLINIRNKKEVAVLEIKSINDNKFKELKSPKEEHIVQGLTYVYCLETHRKHLKEMYPTPLLFAKSFSKRKEEYALLYDHLQSGRHYTREEKIQFQVNLHIMADKILYNLDTPITTVVFLYENKNDQELAEYPIHADDPKYKDIMSGVLRECEYLNECVKNGEIPPRCSMNKTDICHKFCDFKTECWN